MPLVQGFIENVGQLPSEIHYYLPVPNGLVYITNRGYGYVWYRQRPRDANLHAHRVELHVPTPHWTHVQPNGLLPTTLNIYRGTNRFEHIRVYREVAIENIAPGMTAVFRLRPNGTLKCDYHATAARHARTLTLTICGAAARIAPNGKLKLCTRFGDIVEGVPLSFASALKALSTRYVLKNHTLHFQIDSVDDDEPLTIDPEIEWSSYAGGSAQDQWAHVQTDAERNVIVIGRTQSLDFPTRFGYTSSLRGDYDAVVAKYRPDGSLLWATYYGGSRREIHSLDHCGLAVDRTGSIFIAGCTQSDDLPLTQAAFQSKKASSMPSGYDLFLAQFQPNGQLQWASYCGGNDNEDIYGITIDRQGNIYLVGHTSSDDLPQSSPRPFVTSRKPTSSQDVFVLKLSQFRSPLWVHFIGGKGVDVATGAVTDGTGGVYVCGYTLSADFPTRGSDIYQSIKTAATDGFLFKLDGLGQLQWCTLLGGNGDDYCTSIAVDSSFDRRIIVGGTTNSTDMWYRGAGKRTLGGIGDGFVAAFLPQTGSAQWVHYHGGGSYDELTALAVDPGNSIIIVGRTLGDYPTRGAQQQRYQGGGGDMFIAKLASDGTTQWATYAGGSFLDRATDVAIIGSTSFVVVGHSSSADFPIFGTSAQPHLGNSPGTDDGVLLTYCNIAIPEVLISGTLDYCQGEIRTLRITNRGSNVRFDSYQWLLDSIPIPGATDESYTLADTLPAGIYRFVCRVTNSTQCSAVTDTITVRIHSLPQISSRSYALCSGEALRLDSITVIGEGPFRYEWSGTPPPSDPTVLNPIVLPNQTTTYRLKVTDAHGCSAEQQFTVYVHSASLVPVLVIGERTICEGDSTILAISTPAGDVVWNNGARSFQVVIRSSGHYFASINLQSGCRAFSDTIEIVVLPRPQPAIVYDGMHLRTNALYDSYQWLLDGAPLVGATGPHLVPPRSGSYTVIVDSFGCTGISPPRTITLSATAQLVIGSARVAIGDNVRIPILLTSSIPLVHAGASRLEIHVRYNSTILYLRGTSIPILSRSVAQDGTTTIVLECTGLDRDTIGTMDFLALWGNAEVTTLQVLDVIWDAPTVTTRWSDGTITIEGLCRNGGVRLYDDTSIFGIRSLNPQPCTEAFTTIISTIEDAYHTMSICATDGRCWCIHEQFLRAGTYAFTFLVDSFPTGRYVLVVESPTLVATTPLMIVR